MQMWMICSRSTSIPMERPSMPSTATSIQPSRECAELFKHIRCFKQRLLQELKIRRVLGAEHCYKT
eukprot:587822-Amphidinium_carterae.2